ncbi:hypothetical protein GCM10023083_69920 [Streptomyces phyllanthi]
MGAAVPEGSAHAFELQPHPAVPRVGPLPHRRVRDEPVQHLLGLLGQQLRPSLDGGEEGKRAVEPLGEQRMDRPGDGRRRTIVQGTLLLSGSGTCQGDEDTDSRVAGTAPNSTITPRTYAIATAA